MQGPRLTILPTLSESYKLGEDAAAKELLAAVLWVTRVTFSQVVTRSEIITFTILLMS